MGVTFLIVLFARTFACIRLSTLTQAHLDRFCLEKEGSDFGFSFDSSELFCCTILWISVVLATISKVCIITCNGLTRERPWISAQFCDMRLRCHGLESRIPR